MTTEHIITDGTTPLGMKDNGEVFSISAQDRPGILYVFGRTGQGKSVMLASLVISDIRNGRGGMFIDPYGDLIQEIQSHITPEQAKNVVMFEAQAGTVDENIAKFQKEIDLTQMQSDAHKFLLCKLDYRALGNDGARGVGEDIVKRFLTIVGGQNRTIGIDEAHNFINEELAESIVKARENSVSYIFSDQMVRCYKASVGERLLKVSNHILCYFVDTETANTISTFHPQMSVNELVALQKYHFLAKVNAQTSSPTMIALKGILPKDLFR